MAGLDKKVMELTVVFILLGIVLMPIGLKYILNINKSDIGITSGSTLETVVDNVPVIGLVGVLLAVVYWFKGGKR